MKNSSKLNGMQRMVKRCIPQIVGGTVLAIDPSSSSRNSDPGYALYKGGLLVDSGILEIPSGKDLHIKLQMIAESLQRDFEVPDVLVIEKIPPFIGTRATKSIVALHQSCGAIKAAVKAPRCVEVAPVTWRKYIPEGYLKTDTNDAVMIGYAAIVEAFKFEGMTPPPLKFFGISTQVFQIPTD